MRNLLALVLLLLGACDCNPETITSTSAPAAAPSAQTEQNVEAADPSLGQPVRPARPERPASASERAARFQALPDDERQRSRARAEHLRSGRRLAHAGDHVGALREFSAGLELDPTDGTLLCEAGLQAHRSGELPRARELLERGAAHAVRPATAGACLYNLGRVLEDQSEASRAAEVYTASLRARPNEIVRARLATLEGTLDGEVGEYDEDEGYDADLSNFQPGRTFAEATDLCGTASESECWMDERTWQPTSPSPNFRELRLAWLHSPEDLADLAYILIRSDAHWALGPQLMSCDTGDMYGRVELGEQVDEVRFEGTIAVFEISGSADEAEGEAELYWSCENERPDDAMGCFDEGRADLPAPQTWTRTARYQIGSQQITEE